MQLTVSYHCNTLYISLYKMQSFLSSLTRLIFLFTHYTVESGGLSDGALAGIVIGGVVIVFLVFFLFVALIFGMRRMMSYDRNSGRSISRLAPLDREREAMPFGNGNGNRGDVYPLAYYPSDMELGHMRKPGYSNGAYTSAVSNPFDSL